MIRGAFQTPLRRVNQTGHLEPLYVVEVPLSEVADRFSGGLLLASSVRGRSITRFGEHTGRDSRIRLFYLSSPDAPMLRRWSSVLSRTRERTIVFASPLTTAGSLADIRFVDLPQCLRFGHSNGLGLCHALASPVGVHADDLTGLETALLLTFACNDAGDPSDRPKCPGVNVETGNRPIPVFSNGRDPVCLFSFRHCCTIREKVPWPKPTGLEPSLLLRTMTLKPAPTAMARSSRSTTTASGSSAASNAIGRVGAAAMSPFCGSSGFL